MKNSILGLAVVATLLMAACSNDDDRPTSDAGSIPGADSGFDGGPEPRWVYACDNGASALCETETPTCDEGEVLATYNLCFSCIQPEQCGEYDPPK